MLDPHDSSPTRPVSDAIDEVPTHPDSVHDAATLPPAADPMAEAMTVPTSAIEIDDEAPTGRTAGPLMAAGPVRSERRRADAGAERGLGQYREAGEVRRWERGQIVEAVHRRLGRRVWLWKLDAALVADPEARERFLETFRRLALLDHPNVTAGVREASGVGTVPYAACDPDDTRPPQDLGPSWRSDPAREWLYPNDRLAQLLLDAARGLEAVHGAGLVFGGLTVDSLRVVPTTGRLRLPGLETHPAPELSSGAADTRAGDVRNLGASFFHFLTGRPVPADTDLASSPGFAASLLRQAHPGVGRKAARVIGRCLATRSPRRITTATELVKAAEPLTPRRTELATWPERLVALLFEAVTMLTVGPLRIFRTLDDRAS